MRRSVLMRSVTVAAAAALVLSGCGNGDDGDDADDNGAETTQEQSPGPDDGGDATDDTDDGAGADDGDDTDDTDDGAGADDGDDTDDDTIVIENFEFTGDMTVEAGDDFEVVNRDDVMHTLTADDGEFDSGEIAGGESTEMTIDEPGEYGFHCTPHPDMTGTLTVVEDEDGSTDGTDDDDTDGADDGDDDDDN